MVSVPVETTARRYDSVESLVESYGVALDPQSPASHIAGLQMLDDADLVIRAVGTDEDAPDPEAFGVLYLRNVHAIFAFAMSRLHNRMMAEDMTSQTFLQALQALPRYEQRGLPIRPWLFQIAANLIAGLSRSASRSQAGSGDRDDNDQDGHGVAPVADVPDPLAEAEIVAREAAEEFYRLLDVLPPAQRTVIRLRFAHGMGAKAIAVRTGRTAGAVKALQFRGVRELRRRWEQEPD